MYYHWRWDKNANCKFVSGTVMQSIDNEINKLNDYKKFLLKQGYTQDTSISDLLNDTGKRLIELSFWKETIATWEEKKPKWK